MSELSDPGRNICALSTLQSVSTIPNVIPILHAGGGCGLRIYDSLVVQNGYQAIQDWHLPGIPCDNIHRAQLIFGSEKALKDLIEATIKVIDAELYVVLSGCNVELAGDDIQAVVKKFQTSGIPIIAVPNPGFAHNAYRGHEQLCTAMLRALTSKKSIRKKGFVNLWSSIPYLNPFWLGNITELGHLLRRIGLEVNFLFGPQSSLESWIQLSNAELNILVSPWVGLETMKVMEQEYNIPYLHFPLLPIGSIATKSFLSQITQALHLSVSRVNSFIEKKEKEYSYFIERIWDLLSRFDPLYPDHFFIAGDAETAMSVGLFLQQELGIEPTTIFITDQTPEPYRHLIRREMNSTPIVFSASNEDIKKTFSNLSQQESFFHMGSALEASLVASYNGRFLEISYPLSDRLILDRNYCGWNGSLRLLEDIFYQMEASKAYSKHL